MVPMRRIIEEGAGADEEEDKAANDNKEELPCNNDEYEDNKRRMGTTTTSRPTRGGAGLTLPVARNKRSLMRACQSTIGSLPHPHILHKWH